mmetsp:Transcript_16684/g.20059  ORF Transcript_16684/g.20059 Transcript_16684/m.20059 type:complete len:116 (-) Transcript_16684:311-658(-)
MSWSRAWLFLSLVACLTIGLFAQTPEIDLSSNTRGLKEATVEDLQEKIHERRAEEHDNSHEDDEGFKAYREWKKRHSAGEIKHAFKGKIDPKHVHHLIREEHKKYDKTMPGHDEL